MQSSIIWVWFIPSCRTTTCQVTPWEGSTCGRHVLEICPGCEDLCPLLKRPRQKNLHFNKSENYFVWIFLFCLSTAETLCLNNEIPGSHSLVTAHTCRHPFSQYQSGFFYFFPANWNSKRLTCSPGQKTQTISSLPMGHGPAWSCPFGKMGPQQIKKVETLNSYLLHFFFFLLLVKSCWTSWIILIDNLQGTNGPAAEFKWKLDEDYIGYLLDLSFPPRRRCVAVSPGVEISSRLRHFRIQEGTLLRFDDGKKKRHSSTRRRAQFARPALELYLSLIYTSNAMRKQLQLLAAVTVNQW